MVQQLSYPHIRDIKNKTKSGICLPKNVLDITTIPERGAGRTNYLQTEVYEYHHLDWVDTKYNAPPQ